MEPVDLRNRLDVPKASLESFSSGKIFLGVGNYESQGFIESSEEVASIRHHKKGRDSVASLMQRSLLPKATQKVDMIQSWELI